MRRTWVLFFLVLLEVNAVAASKLQLEDIFVNTVFFPTRVKIQLINGDNQHFTFLDRYQEIIKKSFVDSTEHEVVFSIRELIEDSIYYIWDYQLSDDRNLILFSTNFSQRYRRSLWCDYYLLNLTTKEKIKVNKDEKILNAKLSPDNKHIAYVLKNNIYLFDIETGQKVPITHDGKSNEIINGSPDWLYEEEFSLVYGFYWSPDGNKLAYYKFNEKMVNDFILHEYDRVYPTIYNYKYPKAGEENSKVNIQVYDINSKSETQIDLGFETDFYVPVIKWTPWNDTISLVMLNRPQNKVDILLADAKTGNSKIIYSETTNTYISEPDSDYPYFIENERYIIISSEKDGFNRYYLYSKMGDSLRRIDNSEYDATQILGYNKESKELFFSSSESSPVESQIYSINLETGKKNRLTFQPGWNSATFSNDGDYYVLHYSSSSIPDIYTVHNTINNQKWDLTDNSNILQSKKRFNYSPKRFFQVTTKNGTFNAYMITPLQMDKKKKYPVLVNVYGGPESNEVINSWNGYRDEWFQYLAQQGYIIACMDGRGTAGRGTEFKNTVYSRLGKLETEDQIDFAKYLAKESYIDKNRIGIFGWSYGGYMTLFCLEKGADIFKTGISVAPITHWKFYDTAFTERYMKKPGENKNGYYESAPLNYVSEFKNRFLLVHGSNDDNVHFQHSAELIKELVKYDKPYDLLFFPDSNHNINEGNSLLYLYKRMSEYILQNL